MSQPASCSRRSRCLAQLQPIIVSLRLIDGEPMERLVRVGSMVDAAVQTDLASARRAVRGIRLRACG